MPRKTERQPGSAESPREALAIAIFGEYRYAILRFLLSVPDAYFGEILAGTNIPEATLHRRLKELRDDNLVLTEQRSRAILYRLNNRALADFANNFQELLRQNAET